MRGSPILASVLTFLLQASVPAAAQPRAAAVPPATAGPAADAATVDPTSAVGTSVNGVARISLSLHADVARVVPGDSFHVGVRVTMAPGWHIYARNPGAAGFATELQWNSGDASLAGTAWPAPQVFHEREGILTYGYANEVLFTSDAIASDSLGDSLQLEATVRYLACNVICSPGEVHLRLRLPTAQTPLPADAATQALFAASAAQRPRAAAELGIQLEALQEATPLRPGDSTRLALTLRQCVPAAAGGSSCRPLRAQPDPLVPTATPGLALVAMAGGDGDGPTLWLQASADPEVDVLPSSLDAILALRDEQGPLPPIVVRIPLTTGNRGDAVMHSAASTFAQPMPSPPIAAWALPATPLPWWRALVLALLGGMILNLMPCVLPVLGIKLLGLAQAGALDRRQALAQGAAYGAGVVGSMLVLASAVIGLRQLGTQVGWGFQFQEPGFVAAVSTVLVLFGLNCFGVFELTTGGNALAAHARRSHGLARSAWEGVLAVVLATPCSAPFLGSAVAFALSRSNAAILSIFATIGLGLAAPYVALMLLPAQRRWLPRPGAWMNHLKTLLGFGLLGTAIWLVWLIGRFGGIDAMARLLLYLLGISLVAWLYGLVMQRHPARPLPQWAGLALLLAGIGAIALNMRPEPPLGEPLAGDAEALIWRPYQPSAVLAELSAGHPVFVEFTADWCITCKFNEQRVLRDTAVVAAFRETHTSLLRADWTRRDPALQAILASFERAGVPMYLLYHPSRPNGPLLLPEAIGVDMLLNALHAAP